MATTEKSVKRARVRSLRKWVYDLKDGQHCADCHNTFPPCVLQFDHLPKFKKKETISHLISWGYSKKFILSEIKKCELVCANCHAIRTHITRKNNSK